MEYRMVEVFDNGPPPCRCEELRQAFGPNLTPECGRCRLAKRVAALELAGYVPIPDDWRLRLQDCGVPTQTTSDHRTWTPCWAAHLVAKFLGARCLQPMLCRCAVDEDFARGVSSILFVMAGEEEKPAAPFDVEAAVIDFAKANGVVFG